MLNLVDFIFMVRAMLIMVVLGNDFLLCNAERLVRAAPLPSVLSTSRSGLPHIRDYYIATKPSMSIGDTTGRIITFESSLPFDGVISRIYASIGAPEQLDRWRQIANRLSNYTADDKEKFIMEVQGLIGPHGFMLFHEINHGAWVPIFGVGDGRKAKRIVLGNPLIAINFLRESLVAGLFVPVEILVLEKKNAGGTEIIYQSPRSLLRGLDEDKKFQETADYLDRKLAEFVHFALSK